MPTTFPPTRPKPRQIVLAQNVTREEALTTGQIWPGDLVQVQSDKSIEVHAVEGGFATRLFATEEALTSINDPAVAAAYAKNVDIPYPSGTRASLWQGHPGDRINARLIPGVNYEPGDQLISAGSGPLKKKSEATTTSVVKQVIAEIDEVGGGVDLSGTGAVITRCSVRLL